jgi:tetrahydromethanopterin S-methyltransferase subunit A
MSTEGAKSAAFHIIQEQIGCATAAPKCHKCGCLQQTVEALSATAEGQKELAETLNRARQVFVPKEYDCLGCPVCYPAIATNAFAETYPEAGAKLDLCPTEEPDLRLGWPPLAGDYHVLRYSATVAICTLNSASLAQQIAKSAMPGVAIAGTMHTENLGIERLIRNTSANPNIRFLVVCGEDTQQVIGHLPGQSLLSLIANGMDERKRIVGARGKRPILKNISADELQSFRKQVKVHNLIGQEDVKRIGSVVRDLATRSPGPFEGAAPAAAVATTRAMSPAGLTLDPAGYFVVFPEQRRKALILEHYSNQGVLDGVFEGDSPAALYSTVIQKGLLSRLDHAAYLGGELARAERALETGEPYTQDRAAGALTTNAPSDPCGCPGNACT